MLLLKESSPRGLLSSTRGNHLLHSCWSCHQPAFVHQQKVSTSLLYQTPVDAIVGATTAVSSSASTASLFKYLIVFLAGGLFFSTALSAVATVYAFGLENVRTLWSSVSVVSEKVWETFVNGLKVTRAVLMGDVSAAENAFRKLDIKDGLKWNWKSAWKILKLELSQTKKVAVEGVQAIREESRLYSAAVGAPGLIPIQYLSNNLMPLTSTILQESARQALSDMSSMQSKGKIKTFRKITLSSFTAGKRPPTFKAARFFDVDDSIAFDYDLEWNSELEATLQVFATPLLGMARIPIKLKNLQFDGTVRIILTPITDTPPGYGAMLLSFTKPPNIDFDLDVLGGEITKLPFFKKEMMSQVKKSITEDMLWPRRQVIPSQIEVNNMKKLALTQQVLSDLKTSDPLLKAEERLEKEQPMLRKVAKSAQSKSEVKRERAFLLFLRKRVPFIFKNKKVDDVDEITVEEDDEGDDESLLLELEPGIVNFSNGSFKAQKGILWNYLSNNLSSIASASSIATAAYAE